MYNKKKKSILVEIPAHTCKSRHIKQSTILIKNKDKKPQVYVPNKTTEDLANILIKDCILGTNIKSLWNQKYHWKKKI